jgi:methionyl-tRNA synthetase
MSKFYLTTPIYYVNDIPHVGHAYTTIAADVLARYHRILGDQTFFLTGTDEHGAKVAEAAKARGLEPKEFCDEVAPNFRETWRKLNISHDYFIRTTDPGHEKIVSDFLLKIYENGDIYKGTYEGLYCVGCEKFLTEVDLVDGLCPYHKKKPVKQGEENYFFRLSQYVQKLIKAISDPKDPNHYQIGPESRYNEVLSKLKLGVGDISISRAEVTWGIPIPWDPTQTIYVWVDALINYYSATLITQRPNLWPAELHLMAKDILWFHAVIWPAMLIAAGLKPPKEVFAHGFFTVEGEKMSKTIGNVILPEALVDKFGADGTRYLLLSEFPFGSDGDLSLKRLEERYNSDLANGLGNLVQRLAALAQKAGVSVEPPAEKPLLDLSYRTSLDKKDFQGALNYIWKKISSTDKKIENTKPWELIKRDPQKAETVLDNLVRQIREINELLLPFMPETAAKIHEQFKGPRIGRGEALFPRINQESLTNE